MVKKMFSLAPRSMEVKLDHLQSLRSESNIIFGDTRTVNFLNLISRKLLSSNYRNQNPEFASLGYFLRRANIQKLVSDSQSSANGTYVPRGLVFHVPPANVDTVFMYSWAISLLAGNSNLVRISDRSGIKTKQLLDIIDESMSESDQIFTRTQFFVQYAHDDELTRQICDVCDLRVVWGGDQTVTSLRDFPLQPLARELSFPNRTSFSAINLDAWFNAGHDTIAQVGDGFVRDIYWFDQAACSSPSMIFTVGEKNRLNDFLDSFGDVVVRALEIRGIEQEPSILMEKTVRSTVSIAQGNLESSRSFSDRIFIASVSNMENASSRNWAGVGAVAIVPIDNLNEIPSFINRTDQTMTYFGFSQCELRSTLVLIGQKGIDRIVPIGTALDFSHVWDGMNLIAEYTREVTIN